MTGATTGPTRSSSCPADLYVAGAPPDDLNREGQLWGNPLYDWPALATTGYRWWIERMRRALVLCDRFRLDHFRGFAAYWAVPTSAATAREGHWQPGPGAALFLRAEAELGRLPVIAEDLGIITPDVIALRDEFEFPGTVVMLWSQLGPDDNPHRLENHRVGQVVYTSTHDTETLAARSRTATRGGSSRPRCTPAPRSPSSRFRTSSCSATMHV